MTLRVGMIGARGYVGGELVRLLAGHPEAEIVWIGSTSRGGHPVELEGAKADLVYSEADPDSLLRREVDVVFLGVPNGEAKGWASSIDARAKDTCIIDLSTDHRLDEQWVYGNPEHNRTRVAGARRIANPGCYATAALLAIAPVAECLRSPATVFGVSGYSGAGAKPSPRNDPDMLRDNVVPYTLTDHSHERELERVLRQPVRLLPHVSSFFRGMMCTVALSLRAPVTRELLFERYRSVYSNEHFVRFIEGVPLLRDACLTHHVTVGGVSVASDGFSASVVSVLDNLLAGAASQAIRNMNLAFGLNEELGLA